MNQLFIGVWNHREKDGTISDKGGVFTDPKCQFKLEKC